MISEEEKQQDSHGKKHVIIVGGGLVGSLNALYFAQRSYQVDVYEYRPDPRTQEYVAGRSINLALSERGRAALRAVGAEAHIIEKGIPMYARMIHSYDGRRTEQVYGKKDQYIMSIDRRKLNEHLISLVDTNPNVSYYFNDKFIGGDFKKGDFVFENKNGQHVEKAHLMVGCDGSYSGARKQLMKTIRMNFSQEYIPHSYKEIGMPTNMDGEFAMEVNYLHIWPRNTFMMIALPNQDKTFTCTLFMPNDKFDTIKTDEDIIHFFEREFSDAIPLIGKDKIIKDFKTNPVGELISIKCSPYHYSDKVVLMGDAAHAMVPFYGQGMNSGFEDCLVLHEILTKYMADKDLTVALEEYSSTRNPDVEAIVDLAMYNYIEMRSHVNSSRYLIRKKVDSLLHWLAPNYWVPLYTMTSFTRIPYHEVIKRSKKQDQIVKWITSATLFGVALFGVSVVYKSHIYDATVTNISSCYESISKLMKLDFY